MQKVPGVVETPGAQDQRREEHSMKNQIVKDEKMNSRNHAQAPNRAPRSMRRRLGVGTVAVLSGVASVAGLTLIGSGTAGAATLDGTATLTTPSDGAISYPSPSSTIFEVNVPNGAVCSSNTATNGTKVYTYLVPSGTSVSGLTISDEAVASPS
jgi:hypothetical protein